LEAVSGASHWRSASCPFRLAHSFAYSPIGPSRGFLRCVYYALFLPVFSHNSLAHFFLYCDNDPNYKLEYVRSQCLGCVVGRRIDRSTPPYSYRIIYELRFSRTYLIPPDLVTSMAHKPFRLQVRIQTDPSEVFDIPDSNLEPPERQRLKEGQDGNA